MGDQKIRIEIRNENEQEESKLIMGPAAAGRWTEEMSSGKIEPRRTASA